MFVKNNFMVCYGIISVKNCNVYKFRLKVTIFTTVVGCVRIVMVTSLMDIIVRNILFGFHDTNTILDVTPRRDVKMRIPDTVIYCKPNFEITNYFQ